MKLHDDNGSDEDDDNDDDDHDDNDDDDDDWDDDDGEDEENERCVHTSIAQWTEQTHEKNNDEGVETWRSNQCTICEKVQLHDA